jgi:dihydrofolate reductase
MRKLIEATLVSLDGVVGSPEEWALPSWDEENKEYAHAQLADVDAFLLGRVTYEKFAAAWSQVTGDPYLDTINRRACGRRPGTPPRSPAMSPPRSPG